MKKILLVLSCLLALGGCTTAEAMQEDEERVVISVTDDEVKWYSPNETPPLYENNFKIDLLSLPNK